MGANAGPPPYHGWMRNPHDPVEALEERQATQAAQPLLTCYDLADGSRVEFSARTFANWVDKTAGLMGSLGFDTEPDVGLPLLLTHPGHWVGLVWSLATWQLGGTVTAQPRDDLDRVDLAVVGPEQPNPVPGVETVACSLHPLGAGLAQRSAGVTDYAEVLSQPDVHWREGLPGTWLDDGHTRHAEASLQAVEPRDARLLVRPAGDPWTDLATMLVAPLLGGGSTVVVRGRGDEQRLAAIAASERADLA